MPTNLDFSLYLNIFFFGLLALGMFIGFLRGYKKAAFNLIAMSIYFVIFFLTVDIVVNFLWSLSIPGLGGLIGGVVPDAASASSLEEALTMTLEASLGDSLGTALDNPEFIAFINALSILILKIVYAILYFTVLRFIYQVIVFILGLIFVRYHKDEGESKHRLIGSVIGIFRGALTVYLMLVLLGGIVSFADSALTIMPEEEALQPVKNVVDAYNNNLIVTSASILETEDSDGDKIPVHTYLFDRVLSFKYDLNADDDKEPVRIILRKELANGADIYDVYNQSTFKQSENLSDITSEEISQVFTLLSQSNLFTTALPLGIEVAANQLDTEIVLPKEELYALNWEEEMLTFERIVTATFDIISTAGITGENKDYETVTFDGENVRGLFDEIASSEVANLAAYHAVEPILRKAGSNVQAFITVPEGFTKEDWADEYRAIGSIAGEIADQAITLKQLRDNNTSELIKTLADVNFTILLESELVKQSLINIFSGTAEIEGFDVFKVPANVKWDDYVDEHGVTQPGELRNILEAVNTIADVAEDVDFANLDLKVISKFDGDEIDETINAVFASDVFVATISSMLTDMDLGNTPLVIADDVFDPVTGYITKVELTNLAKSASMVFTNLSCDEGNTTCSDTGFDVTKAFDLSDDDINKLLLSQIISNTIGDLIIDQAGDVLQIPPTALLTIAVKGVNQDVVNGDEIEKLFRAVSALGITDINNMNFDASIIKNLAVDETTNSTVLDQTKADKLFASEIIHATLSKMILDQEKTTQEPNKVLVIPYRYKYKDTDEIAYPEGELVRKTIDNIEYIERKELTQMLKSVLKIDITDFNAIDGLNLDKIVNNTDTLLDTSIIHATLSDQLVNLGGNIITIPKVDADNNPVRISYGTDAEEKSFITRNELTKLLDNLKLFNITDFNNIDGKITINTFFDETNQVTLLSSAIIHATVTDQILKLNDPNSTDKVLVVPTTPFNDASDPVQVTLEGTTFIDKNEIYEILDVFSLIDQKLREDGGDGLNDTSDFQTIDLSIFYAPETQTTLLESASIHATITDKLIKLDQNILKVPTLDEFGNPVIITKGTDTYVDDDEIKAIINFLEIFGVTDVNNFPSTIDISEFWENGNLLVASASVQARITKELTNLGPSILTIPYVSYNDQPVRITQDTTEFINDDEILAVLDIFKLISDNTPGGIHNINEFPSTIDISIFYGNDGQTTLLSSAAIHATISDKVFDLTTNATIEVFVPDFTINGTPVIEPKMVDGLPETKIDYLSEVEIRAIINNLEILGFTDINQFTGAITLNSYITNLNNEQDTLLSSAIMHATISNKIDKLNSSLVIIPYNSIHNDNHGFNFVVEAEIKALIDALGVLGFTDVSDFDTTFTLENIGTPENRQILVDSQIIQATISRKLIDLDDTFLVVPLYRESDYNNEDPANMLITVDHDVDFSGNPRNIEYIDKEEIKALIHALDLMNYDNIDSLNAEINLDKFFANSSTILDSASLQATISSKLLDDLNNGDLIIPDSVRIQVTSQTYVAKVEILAMLTALDELNLTNFNSISMDPTTIFSIPDIETTLLASASIHATISNTIINTSQETAAPGTLVLLVPATLKEAITVGGDSATYENIQKSELLNLLKALDVLGTTAFDGAMNAGTITNLTYSDLSIILNSDSIHVTLDNMLKDNPHITVPELAKENVVYVNYRITTKEELINFILAAKEFSSDTINFTNVQFDLATVAGLADMSPTSFDTILNSMIVRNALTDQIEAIIGVQDPALYEGGSTDNFLTKQSIINLIPMLMPFI